MPLFHCPMGAPYYEADNCILCGLCLATTKEEMIAATDKIRAYLQAHAEKQAILKKWAVTGKGGTGKSTITALIANCLREEGFRVLVIDTDESNPGMQRKFGFEEEPKPLLHLLSRFAIGEPEPDTEWLTKDEITFDDIPPEYVLESDNLKFMMVGKIENPFQGCACTMTDITKELLGKFKVRDKEVVLVDTEAGVESFGRGLERNMDTVLIIVEPSYESVNLAGKIDFMADGIGVSTVRAICNKVPSEEINQQLIKQLTQKEVKVIGTVFVDPKVSETNFTGEPLGESQAKEEVRKIVRSLLVLIDQIPEEVGSAKKE